jgi:starvation-inducible DNA-binding protein
MNELQAALKIVLANSFVMYFKAHSYHWSVVGPNFSQYHGFFGDLYSEVYGSVDDIAEHIRAIDGLTPISIMDLYDAKTIMEDGARVVMTEQMFSNLLDANNELIHSLNKAFDLSTYAKNQGLCNYLADRLDRHAKHGWQIKSFIK